MIRYLVFYFVSAIVLFLCLYLTNYYGSCSDDSDVADSGRKIDMVREAELVSYFCLSKRPPVIGEVSIPRAWESALHASIKVCDNTSEAGSSLPEASDKVEGLSTLNAGESIYAETEKERILVYRPKQSPEWFLVITKPLDTLKDALATSSHCGKTSMLLGSLFGALVLTLLARFTIGRVVTKS